MAQQKNAPAPELNGGQSVVCHLLAGGDIDASKIRTVRTQFLVRAGHSMDRAALLSSLIFGEGAHV